MSRMCVMIRVLGHNFELWDYTGPGTSWMNGRNFVMNHVPGVRLIAGPVDKQSVCR